MRVYEALTMLFQIMMNKNQLMIRKIVSDILGDCQKYILHDWRDDYFG